MIPGSINALLLGEEAGGAAAYSISRSLRFNSSDSAYLSRTPASAGNRKTWTFAFWMKKGNLSSSQYLLLSNPGITDSTWTVLLWASGSLVLSGAATTWRSTTQVFRDPAAWYHFVLAVDTTAAVAADRIKFYVNGSQITAFTTANNPAQNLDLAINNSALHTIAGSPATFDGYLADIYLVDGQALLPTSFGEFDATTGVWNPKAYTGTYGTNGFQLKFADNSAATATTLGKDTSGNSNNWTPHNLSVTAGAGNDSLVDTPTSYGTDTGAGGEVRGNYCTWNPLDNGGSVTLSNGNLDITTPSSGLPSTRGTLAVSSGKWFYEFTVSSGAASIGFLKTTDTVSGFLGNTSGAYAYYSEGASYKKKINNGIQTDYGAGFVAGDVIGVALDLDAGTITFYKNGASQGQAFSGLSGTFAPAVSDGNNAAGISGSANFGQRPFAYTAPSGFKALCDTNLPAPVVAKPNTAFDVALWTGNGSARSITGLNFNPDFVWIKGRSGATDHALYDVVRGTEKRLESNTTDAEVTSDGGVTAFNSDGFSLGTLAQVNTNSSTYVGWAWDGGTSTVTNTQGSITSQVRANASAGFSIVTYTGIGSTGTVGHGLGVAPSFYIVKARTTTAANSWRVYHSALGNTKQLFLQDTAAASTNSSAWNNTSPTSTVFSVGSLANESSGNYVAYVFSPVAGYSSGFSYTGNGSTDGSFVYLGFRPRLILLKCSSTTGNWTLLDTAREGYNVDNDPLYPNLSDAEGTTDLLDITSNGFKLRTTDASVNSSGATYVGYAWAEAPFAYSRAR